MTMEIRNVFNQEQKHRITVLPGITGFFGARGNPVGSPLEKFLGLDIIEMEPGKQFPLHTHIGGHIIFVLEGKGTVTIGKKTYHTKPGDVFFIQASDEHAVGAVEYHKFAAIGYPHTELTDAMRMNIVDPEFLSQNPIASAVYSGSDVIHRQQNFMKLQSDVSKT